MEALHTAFSRMCQDLRRTVLFHEIRLNFFPDGSRTLDGKPIWKAPRSRIWRLLYSQRTWNVGSLTKILCSHVSLYNSPRSDWKIYINTWFCNKNAEGHHGLRKLDVETIYGWRIGWPKSPSSHTFIWQKRYMDIGTHPIDVNFVEWYSLPAFWCHHDVYFHRRYRRIWNDVWQRTEGGCKG